jgi:hypothetical protein
MVVATPLPPGRTGTPNTFAPERAASPVSSKKTTNRTGPPPHHGRKPLEQFQDQDQTPYFVPHSLARWWPRSCGFGPARIHPRNQAGPTARRGKEAPDRSGSPATETMTPRIRVLRTAGRGTPWPLGNRLVDAAMTSGRGWTRRAGRWPSRPRQGQVQPRRGRGRIRPRPGRSDRPPLAGGGARAAHVLEKRPGPPRPSRPSSPARTGTARTRQRPAGRHTWCGPCGWVSSTQPTVCSPVPWPLAPPGEDDRVGVTPASTASEKQSSASWGRPLARTVTPPALGRGRQEVVR